VWQLHSHFKPDSLFKRAVCLTPGYTDFNQVLGGLDTEVAGLQAKIEALEIQLHGQQDKSANEVEDA
jgi:hypothetical protein